MTTRGINSALASGDEIEVEAPESVDQLTKKNIALIAELDRAAQSKRTITDRIVDLITGFCGRMAFVWVHVVWFGAWVTLNLTHKVHFDPYPFNLLTLTVSLEAIFLSTFILISQNRQGRLAERRSHLDLQINLLSEQENTKMLTMLASIQEHLGILQKDPETQILIESTQPGTMLEQIEELIEGEAHADPQKIELEKDDPAEPKE